jgi:hypothetical protein
MTRELREALDRTLLLMRDELVDYVGDQTLLAALTQTRVLLIGDRQNLTSHAAQSAYVTAALLMARSGHQVVLAAPDVPLQGPQPPLKGTHLLSALMEIGGDLLPGIGYSVYPRGNADLAVVFGDSPARYRTTRIVGVNAHAWLGHLCGGTNLAHWAELRWPIGAMAAGALAATEAFKITMQRLRPFANNLSHFDEFFGFVDHVSLELAPADASKRAALGEFDFISGGAITNASLYALARLPDVVGRARIVEPDTAELSNLNRYMFLRRSLVGSRKTEILKVFAPAGLGLHTIPLHYPGHPMPELGQLAPNVLVGVDDIPVRWQVQAENPNWLGIGATAHWGAMASFHHEGLGCAQCLHPRDEPTAGRIPTAAFISFFSGLMLANYFTRMTAGERIPALEQYTYLAPPRPERPWRSPVALRPECQICKSGPRRAAPRRRPSALGSETGAVDLDPVTSEPSRSELPLPEPYSEVPMRSFGR